MCSPTTPTIRVRIPLMPGVFSVNFLFEKNKNKLKRGRRGWPFLKKIRYVCLVEKEAWGGPFKKQIYQITMVKYRRSS